MPKIIFVEGNIGTGKSTFLKMIEKCYGDKYQVIYEPVDCWTNFKDSKGKNILKYFYEDTKRYAYTFQHIAFISRIQKFDEIDETKEIVFIERSIWSDRHIFAQNCFEQNMINDIEHELYLTWFTWLEKKLKFTKHEFLYLKCSPETSFSRMHLRSRDEENNVSFEYLKQIHNKHEEWIKNECMKTTVTTVDAEQDLTIESDFKEVFQFIVE
jgi:deoxyadenosine/deoxycytidine kinase